jgi:hypothetical protein
MKNNTESILLACIIIALVPLALIFSTIIDGWALSTLWGWFVVPLFKLPALPIFYAMGLGLIASALHPTVSVNDKDRTTVEKVGVFVARIFVLPVFLVFIGWIIQMFI